MIEIAKSLLDIGDVEGARSSAERSKKIIEELLTSNPDNANWQHDLSVSYDMVGDTQVVRGDLVGALASFRAGLAIMTGLTKADPNNSTWQRELAVSNAKLGDVQTAQGDLAGALNSFGSSITTRNLALGDPHR